MPHLRPLTSADIPAVAALRGRIFHYGRRTGKELERYFRQVYLENPWADPALPCWVAEHDGELVAFMGVIPRPFHRAGRRVIGVLCSQMMVAPEHRGILSAQLMRRTLSGAQHFSYSDVVTFPVRRLWEAAGGGTAAVGGFTWTIPLRRASHQAAQLGSHPAVRAFRLLARPALNAADALTTAQAVLVAAEARVETIANPTEELHDLVDAIGWRGLTPEYEPAATGWLLAHARDKWRDHRLQAVRVEIAGETAGWFLYLEAGRGTAQVVQLAAAPGKERAVLQQLLTHARQTGSMAIRGRAEAQLLDALSAEGARWGRDNPGILFHSADPSLLATTLAGDALITGLEGEWWLDF